MEELRLFRSKRRRPVTAVLVRQASGVDADGGRRSAKPPCGTLRRRRRRHLRCWLSSSSILASICFLRFPSDYPNLVLDVVSGCAHIYWNLIQLLGFKMVHGCACNVRPFYVPEKIFQFSLRFFPLPPTDRKRG